MFLVCYRIVGQQKPTSYGVYDTYEEAVEAASSGAFYSISATVRYERFIVPLRAVAKVIGANTVEVLGDAPYVP